MSGKQFKPGDTVLVKSGGPHMTIERWDENHEAWLCVWFVGPKQQRDYFDENVLKTAEVKRRQGPRVSQL